MQICEIKQSRAKLTLKNLRLFSVLIRVICGKQYTAKPSSLQAFQDNGHSS